MTLIIIIIIISLLITHITLKRMCATTQELKEAYIYTYLVIFIIMAIFLRATA